MNVDGQITLIRARRAAGVLLVAAAFLLACRHVGPFVWVDALPDPDRADSEYRIAPGDVLAIRVWQQDTLSSDRTPVRDDGDISVPLLQDVHVTGLTLTDLSKQLQARLKPFIVNPVVTVALVEQRQVRVSVLGEVAKQGTYDVAPGTGLLAVLAAAGGLSPYAHDDRIFVLRRDAGDGGAAPTRIRFRLDALRAGERKSSAFQLETGDVVVVE